MSNLEQTLSIIKPDAVERNLENEIKETFKSNGFTILKEKKNIKLYVSIVETHENSGEIDTLKNIVEKYIDGWDAKLLNNSCGTMPENNQIGNIEEKNIRGRGHSGVCFQPFSSFTITAEGYCNQKNLSRTS